MRECHNKNTSSMCHCKIQFCASKENYIVFLFLKAYFWVRVGKVDGIFINFSGMKLQSISPEKITFVITIWLKILHHECPIIWVMYGTNKASWWPLWCICESKYIITMVSLKWFIRIVYHNGGWWIDVEVPARKHPSD